VLSDFLRLLLDVIEFIWPLKRIEQYESGVYFKFGRKWKEVGPGIHWRLPWFIEVHNVSMAWSIVETGRKDITTKDGRTLSFAASTMHRVVDAAKSVINIHDYENGMHTILGSVLAEKLASVDPERFGPDKRARLNTDLKNWVMEEAAEIGVEIKWVRFTSFVINPRTYRLLSEQIGAIG
jgi:regulator of protease activity HflC (stomatin/prohibitin superfamily)